MIDPITGIIITIGLVNGASNMLSADSNRERAERKNTRAIRQLGDSFKEEFDAKQKAGTALIQLANRKQGIIQSSIPKFIDVFKRIELPEGKIKTGDRLKELVTSEQMASIIDGLEQLCLSVNSHRKEGAEFVSDMLSATGKIAGIGALTGFAYFGGALGAAEGGLIFAMNHAVLPAAVIMGVTGSIERDSKMELQQAKGRQKFVDVYSEHAKNEVEVARAIYEPAIKFKEFLTKANALFVKAIAEMENIVDKSGGNVEQYTDLEKQCIVTCINFAYTIGVGIRQPLYDENSNVIKQALAVISEGNMFLQKMEQIMTR